MYKYPMNWAIETVISKVQQNLMSIDECLGSKQTKQIIECILLNYTLPKIVCVELRNYGLRILRGKYIVSSVMAFFEPRHWNGELNSSEIEGLEGKTFESLDSDMKRAFLNYDLYFRNNIEM